MSKTGRDLAVSEGSMRLWWQRGRGVAIGVIAAICLAAVTLSIADAKSGRKTRVGLIVFDLTSTTGSPTDADEIWAVRSDGTGARRLAFGYAPAWSRDGRTIAYVNPLPRTRSDERRRQRQAVVLGTVQLL
jgi:hypothetical protein